MLPHVVGAGLGTFPPFPSYLNGLNSTKSVVESPHLSAFDIRNQ